MPGILIDMNESIIKNVMSFRKSHRIFIKADLYQNDLL